MKKTFRPFLSLLSFISALALSDLYYRFISSYLGLLWVFFQPVITLVILWFVFSLGFKVVPVSGVEFMVWLVPGYLSWQYIGEVLSSGTSSIIEKSYLVKKMVFRVEILPAVKLMSGIMMHMVFIMIMLMIYVVKGYGLRMENVQIIYYVVSSSALMYGIIMVTSSVGVFVRDMQPVMNMVIQLGFWGTPIFWDIKMLPEQYRWIIELNPFAYVVEGYRQSMLGGVWFWERSETLYYWAVTVTVIWIGRMVFRRLRPHFADML